jgi:cysteine desulfurase / selenocysteine lyase
MSTNEANELGGLAARAPKAPPMEQGSSGQAGSFPDVAMLTRMANEFFQAQPNGLPATPYAPPVRDLTPQFETRLPQFGMPGPSMPAAPIAPQFSPLLPAPAAATALPGGAAVPETGVLQHDPRSATAAIPGSSITGSPFSLPMPEFGSSLFPPFDLGIPNLAPLPPLRNEDDARAALTASSPFYFLEGGGLPTASPDKTGYPVAGPSAPGVGDLKLSRQQFDIGSVRKDFPILQERVNGHPLIWLDNAATTQKPQSVIDRLAYFYQHENSNIHRAAHELAARATDESPSSSQTLSRR